MLKSKKGIIKPKLDPGNLGLEIRRIATIFTKAGLKEISVPSLLNSSDLVDLYGEDLKLRAYTCLLYTSPSPRDWMVSRMPSSA